MLVVVAGTDCVTTPEIIAKGGGKNCNYDAGLLYVNQINEMR